MRRHTVPFAFIRCAVISIGVTAAILLGAVTELVGTANAGMIAMDDFSSYNPAPTSLNGQAGSPVPLGFAGTWTTPTSTAVVGGALTTGAGDTGRSYRPFATTVTSATGTLSISFIANISSAFSAIEFAPNENNDPNSIRIATSGGNIVLQGNSSGGSEQDYILHSIDGVSHTPENGASHQIWARCQLLQIWWLAPFLSRAVCFVGCDQLVEFAAGRFFQHLAAPVTEILNIEPSLLNV